MGIDIAVVPKPINFIGGGEIMNTVIILKDAVLDMSVEVETLAAAVAKAPTASLLDACTCTGNCC